jgi:hypothetical protein
MRICSDEETARRPPARGRFLNAFRRISSQGCIRLSPDEKAVYYTLIMLLYDAWEPIDDRTVKQRGDLAAVLRGVASGLFRDPRSSCSPCREAHQGRRRPAHKRPVRARARQARPARNRCKSIYPPEKQADKSKINGEINAPPGNDLKGLRVSRTRASPESRVQTEQIRPENEGSQCGKRAGRRERDRPDLPRDGRRSLQASTHRHGWAYRWARMRVELDITVAAIDMIASIETYRGQISVRRRSISRPVQGSRDREARRAHA